VHTTMKKSPSGRSFGLVSDANRNVARLVSPLSAWRTPIAAAVLALAMGFAAQDANALALGRVNVLSGLGEPLRAEVEVPDINADEAATLRTSVAGPDAFKAAGLEYNPALSNVQISLQRRANGSSFLRLTSDKPVNEPFVDLILEANWSSGRIVRDYTMLFDPPNLRAQAAAPSAITSPALGYTPPAGAPVVPRAAPAPAPAPAPYVAASPAPSRAPAPTRAPIARPAPAPKMQARAPAPAAAPKQPGSVTVKAGNTASQLAARYKPQGVSLDQMLVAMLSRNPDAFDAGNINRLKKGAVLEMPSAATASGTSQAEARQTITAQSKDFNEFRRSLAQGAPTASTPAAGRKATGTVQANVEERKPAAAAPDKLTLSKGTVAAAGAASAAKTGKEDAIAKDKQSKDTAARTAELSKNIQDLAKLGATSTTATAKPSISASTTATNSATGVAVATGAPAPKPTAVDKPTATSAVPAVPLTVASAPTPITKPTATATVSVASGTVTATTAAPAVVTAPVGDAKPVAKAAPPAPVPEPGFVEGLMDSPVTLPAAGGLLALLAGFGFYRMRQRKSASQVDSSFLESRLQPDSFFGASGGQRIDTNESAGAGGAGSSSMVYSPSQLDAAGDVDPVAEADVYLAYGRDLQAEEILKEALRTNPTRVAVHAKLMEIYAKRRDTKAFESVAKEAYNVTKGEGADWETACTLGREIDPSNPLYQGGVTASSSSFAPMAGVAMAAAGVGASAFAASTISQPAMAASSAQDADADVDFDLDLDFSASDNLTKAPSLPDPSYSATSPIHVQSTVGMQAQAAVDQPVDLAFDMPTLPQFSLPDTKAVKLSAPDMASFASGLNFSAAPPVASLAPTTPMAINTAPAAPQLDAMDFDMGDLSLDLPTSRAPASAASMAIDAGITGDPLETKLALAQEFREIGDDDGARSLAQEVAAEAKGDLKTRAQRMVADLS
jgi:pilus assembly protein FimV